MDEDGHYDSLQLQQRDDAIYEDLNISPRPRAMPPDKRRYKPVGVGAGLLCAVLSLISIAVLVYLYLSNMTEREQLMKCCNQSLDNLTRERNPSMDRNNNLDQSCIVEREQLVSSTNNLTAERDRLLVKNNKLTRERDQSLDSNNQLTRERDQSQDRNNQLTRERDQSLDSNNQLTIERDQSRYRINQLTRERDQSLDRINQLTRERDQSLDRTNKLTKERDDMKMRLCESPGWQKFDRGCYYISTEKNTWDQSRQWCRDRHSDLIVIKSKAKQDFVASFNKRAWIGWTDKVTEGSFQWVDGTPLTTPTYWWRNEPHFETNKNTNAKEDCVEYYDGSYPGYPDKGWDDEECSDSNYWICERVVC